MAKFTEKKSNNQLELELELVDGERTYQGWMGGAQQMKWSREREGGRSRGRGDGWELRLGIAQLYTRSRRSGVGAGDGVAVAEGSTSPS